MEESGRKECETIAGVSARTEGTKIGAGAAMLLIATPEWARAQSEHEWSMLATSLG